MTKARTVERFSLVLWLAAAPPLAGAQTVRPYDLVLRGGRVLDGAGNPWTRADVAFRDGRFAAIGHLEERGIREIDVSGLYVAPGFIDMMDQSGEVLLQNGRALNKLRMGVTTAIGGEGGTPSVTVDAEGAGAYEAREYFDTLARKPISINFGSYFSETQARVAVLGEDARAPTPAELDRMRSIMAEAMEAGALGMTTALIYPPSSYASTDELVEVAKVAGRYGGIYASHIRGEGKELVESVREAIAVGERGGLPVEIFHFKAAYAPGWGTLVGQAIDEIEAARARGVDVAADLYPYTAGGTGLEATIPSWAHEGGEEALRQRLRDPETRARLKREVETGSPGWWNIIEASGGWENVVLVNARNPANARFEKQSIAAIAKETGKDPRDVAFDLVLEGAGRVMAIYHMMDEADIATALRRPWVSIGSDAGAALVPGEVDLLGLSHPRSYGTFPRILRRFVRELDVLTLEEAVRRMTSWPSTRMRLDDRGLIGAGLFGDAVVFDPERVEDRATYEAPTLFPAGIEYVIVNGELVIDRGEHTGATPGRVLFGPGRGTGTR